MKKGSYACWLIGALLTVMVIAYNTSFANTTAYTLAQSFLVNPN